MNNQSKKRMNTFALGFAVGLLIFFAIYGFSVVNVQNDSFLINGYIEKDIAQHYRGWVLFRNSPWQFPLGVGQNLAYPYGTADEKSVMLTDDNPAESGIITKTSPYSVYKVDGVYVTCQRVFTAKDLTSYTDENFEIIKE